MKKKRHQKKNKVIVKMEKCTYEQSNYARKGKHWYASTLYDFAKAKNYPIVKIQLQAINMDEVFVNVNTINVAVHPLKRIINCSLEYPIIIDDEGNVADGNHRICKALMEGKKYIKAIILPEMPPPDGEYKK